MKTDNRLIHYTSLLNALRILHSKKVKMSNICNCNDYLEKNVIGEDFRTILFFCCSMSELNVPMWLSYSGRNDGAAIVFVFKENCSFDDLLSSDAKKKDEKIIAKEIKYEPDYEDYIADNLDQIGRCKDKKFEFENEFRFFIDMECEIDYEVYSDLNIDCLEKIILLVNKKDESLVKTIISGFNYPSDFIEIKINRLID